MNHTSKRPLSRAAESPAQEDHHHELQHICQALEIESPFTFTFAEHRVEIPPQGSRRATLSSSPSIVAQLSQMLYEHCYVRRFRSQATAERLSASRPDPAFVRALVAANHGGERFDSGWRITQVETSGWVTAAKHGVYRKFPPEMVFSSDRSGGSMPSDKTVTVYLVKGSLHLQPGFYFVFGEPLGEADDPLNLLRIYWNAKAAGIARLVETLTRRLNRFQIPFSFKTLTQPDQYRCRTDSSVLYFHRKYFPIVAQLLAEWLPALTAELETDTPLFTKRLAPGVGLAEDPGTGDSFGLNRCRLLAEALWVSRDLQSTDERIAEVEAHFTRHGLSLVKPYLNPRSQDLYPLPDLKGGPG